MNASVVRTTVVQIGMIAMAVVWLFAAGSKLVGTAPAYELFARMVGGGTTAHVALAFVVFAEVLLGTTMLLDVARKPLPSIVALAVLTGGLHFAKSANLGALPCGCFAGLGDSSVDEAFVRNLWLIGVLGVLLALDVWERAESRRREAVAT